MQTGTGTDGGKNISGFAESGKLLDNAPFPAAENIHVELPRV